MTGLERVKSRIATGASDCLPLMPITMMFATDRIGQPYRQYATDYRVMAEAQLRVAEQFDFDYVSVISDPAREASDCGANIRYFDDQPPAIDEGNALLADKTALAALRPPDPLGGGRMHDRVKGVELLTARIGKQKIVEGWIEGPCAQGADLRGINTLMLDFFDDPAFINDLFGFVIEMETQFARAQVQAGATLIGIGDAAASLVGPELYREFVWPWEKKLFDNVRAMGVLTRLHICGNTRSVLTEMGQLGADIVDLDYFSPVGEARAAMGPTQTLLGNMDPVRVIRNQTPQQIYEATAACHREAGRHFIVGAGCEIPRGTADENVHALRRYARENR
jgi:MtaA/CmuA family methyltransferase